MDDKKLREIEDKWQKKWKEAGLSKAAVKNIDPDKPKFFLHFAYPNVTGYMHIGHMRGYTYTDFIARKKRMEGYNVFFPGGTHATGNNLIAFSQKIKDGQENWIRYMKDNGASEEDVKKVGKSPEEALDYFNQRYQATWKRYGLTIDMESWTSTIFPEYKKFIQWQFLKLKELGYLEQGEYYATVCPEHGPVAVDESETDISKGGKAEKQEYTVLKFRGDDYYLTAATLRPETVFGQTNLFLDPGVEYVKAEVDGETWIVSEPAAEKLKRQDKEVRIKGKVRGEKLIGEYVKAPGVGRDIPILPSDFCDPEEGTGIVTSVPSDAPFDWMGIKVLKDEPEVLEKYGADPEIMEDVVPISIIESPGYGDLPAKEICEEMGIESTDDPRLKDATKEIYKKGFHKGVMKDVCKGCAGKPVEIAKEEVKKDLIDSGEADVLYDLSEEVICRCGEEVYIERKTDQWFINYDDDELTEKSKEHAKEMDIKPEEYHRSIQETLEWFKKRPATRKGNWLGTELPWDRDWVIEPISDSTLYPTFYVVSKFVNRGEVSEENLVPEFFDYVFLEKVSAEEASKKTGLGVDKLKEIREAFDYWYPDDLNEGGKEHQTVHFPPFVMNHVGILPEKYWPRRILVNWYVVGRGSKISKSKGGAKISPWETAKGHGVDAMRLFYGHASTPFADITFTPDKGKSYRKHLDKLWDAVEMLTSVEGDEKEGKIDRWLRSKFNTRLKRAEEAFGEKVFSRCIDELLFEFRRDVKDYVDSGGSNPEVGGEIASRWIRSLAPFAPHICEELWEEIGGDGLVSLAEYPEVEEDRIDKTAEASKELIDTIREDIREIKEITGIEDPEEIKIIVSDPWKYEMYGRVLEGEELSEIMREDRFRSRGEQAASYFQELKAEPDLRKLNLNQEEELEALREMKNLIVYGPPHSGEKITVEEEERSTEAKASKARPGKPAIVLKV